MDPTLASSVVAEQAEMCIQLGLLCTQGDLNLRPTMGRVIVVLSKKPPGHMEEPTRPGIPGSRYRRVSRRPYAMSSGEVDDDSNLHTFDSSRNCGTNTTTSATTPTTSSNTTAEVDRRGKRPMQRLVLRD